MKRDTQTPTFWTADPIRQEPAGQLALPIGEAQAGHPFPDLHARAMEAARYLPTPGPCDRCAFVERMRPSGSIPNHGKRGLPEVVKERSGCAYQVVCDPCFGVMCNAWGDR